MADKNLHSPVIWGSVGGKYIGGMLLVYYDHDFSPSPSLSTLFAEMKFVSIEQ